MGDGMPRIKEQLSITVVPSSLVISFLIVQTFTCKNAFSTGVFFFFYNFTTFFCVNSIIIEDNDFEGKWTNVVCGNLA